MNESEKPRVQAYEKENRENSYQYREAASRSRDNTPPKDHQLEQSYCQRLKLEDSGLVRTPESQPDSMFIEIHDKQKE
jgi:hypothetical protein